MEYRTSADADIRAGVIKDLGITTAKRLGGGNTAYHVPEGIFITYGPGAEPDDSRRDFDVRQAAGVVLGHLRLDEAWATTQSAQSV